MTDHDLDPRPESAPSLGRDSDPEADTGGESKQQSSVESSGDALQNVERRRWDADDAATTSLESGGQELHRRTSVGIGLADLYRRVDQSVVQQSSKAAIDRVVCEHLVDSGWYDAAWIGDVKLAESRVVPRAVAGVPEELVDVVSFDPDVLETATAAAATDGSIRVDPVEPECDDSPALPAFARARNYRWVSGVPLAHEGIRYGVLTLFSAREDALGGWECNILGDLGRTVGHAINAVGRKQALVGDSATELEIRLPGGLEWLDQRVPSASEDYDVRVDRVVPAGNGRIIQYLNVSGISPEDFREALSGVPEVESIREVAEDRDWSRFEVALADYPIASTLALFGGRIEAMRYDVPDLHVTVVLPRDADVRQIDRALRSVAPDLTIDSLRTITRDDSRTTTHRTKVEEDLTERQRTALMTALFAGYFEWPRHSTGEEVAESLDVSPATFHQHLRAAQRKMHAALFELDQ